MTIRKAEAKNHYGTIDLTAIEDPNLTATAKAIHAYAMTRPNGWTFNMTDLLRRFRERKDAILVAFSCLEENGYMKREQQRDENGLMTGVHFTFSDLPVPISERTHRQERKRRATPLTENRVTDLPLTDEPLTDEPLTDEPLTENRVTVLYNVLESTIVEGTTERRDHGKREYSAQTSEYSPAFEEFWQAYPRKLEKQAAWKCWQTRLKEKHLPADLIAAAKYYAEYCDAEGTEPKFIKHGATFLGPNKPFLDWVKGNHEKGRTLKASAVQAEQLTGPYVPDAEATRKMLRQEWGHE